MIWRWSSWASASVSCQSVHVWCVPVPMCVHVSVGTFCVTPNLNIGCLPLLRSTLFPELVSHWIRQGAWGVCLLVHPPPCPEFQTHTVKPSFLCGCCESELKTSLLVQQVVYSLSHFPNPKMLMFHKSMYICLLAVVTSVLWTGYVHVRSTAACIHSILPSLFVKPALSIFAFAGLAHTGSDCAGFKDGLFGV